MSGIHLVDQPLLDTSDSASLQLGAFSVAFLSMLVGMLGHRPVDLRLDLIGDGWPFMVLQ